MVRASPAIMCIAYVLSSEWGSPWRNSNARTIRIRCGSMYAWYSQHTRMMTAPSSGESPNNGRMGYLRSR